MFKDCSRLNAIDVFNFITNNVVNMAFILDNCNKIKNLSVNKFNTSKVISMELMFRNRVALTLYIIQ